MTAYYKNLPYYFVVFCIIIFLKLQYKILDVEDLKFLLSPVNILIEILTSSKSIFLKQSGYYHEKLNIIIDKSCSGFNFWMIGFGLFSFLMLQFFRKRNFKVLSIPTALLLSYLMTILVNFSRIYISILMNSFELDFISNYYRIIHEAIGITTNLTFLILSYLLFQKLLIQTQKNEKFI